MNIHNFISNNQLSQMREIQNQTRIFKNTSSFSETNQIKNILKYWYFALGEFERNQ